VDKRAAAVIAATQAIAGRYANERTVVIGNEARLEVFAACQPDFASRQVLFTGSAGPGHLFPEVVEAVAQVPDVRLSVAGRDPDPVMWSRAESILGDRLTHLGWLNRPGIVGAMSASALGLSTYADTPTNAQNSPNKLFESGAAGLPVVATPTHSNARYLADSRAGLVADGFTSVDLADAISTLLGDEQAWKHASQSGREWAAQHGSWTSSEERLLRLYADVLRLGGEA
jgi:glycosyltransferase involved in cell wall biosynthesis